MASPAFLGFFFCFAAMVLLLFVSVSAPTWNKIYFLEAKNGVNYIRYGIFGYCTNNGCSAHSLGYDLTLDPIGVNYSYTSTVLHNLTKAMILHPIAGALALLAMFWGFLGVMLASRVCTILMALTAFIALLASLIVFAFDLALWIIIRNKFNKNGEGASASLGNANWLTVGACAALILGTCTAALGSCGRFARGRMAGEKY